MTTSKLEHPNVNWLDIRTSPAGRPQVAVLCQVCGKTDYRDKGTVTFQLRRNTFKPRCLKDVGFGISRATRLPRPEHPTVNWKKTSIRAIGGKARLTCVCVTCPICKQERYVSPGPLAAALRRGIFIGRCKECGRGRSHDSLSSTITLSPGRYQLETGYIMITRQTIPENHRPIFDAMVAQKKSSRWSHLLSEHRFNMAVILGRPLESTELVDHMDGDKSHNDPANLRLY